MHAQVEASILHKEFRQLTEAGSRRGVFPREERTNRVSFKDSRQYEGLAWPSSGNTVRGFLLQLHQGHCLKASECL